MELDVPEEQIKEVREILKDHRGVDNAISSAEINERVGIESTDGSQPRTREIIRFLMFEEDMVIGSHTGAGYFLIETEDELLDYIEDLDGRIQSIMERRKKVMDLYRGREPEK
jgi:hypothetical protein